MAPLPHAGESNNCAEQEGIRLMSQLQQRRFTYKMDKTVREHLERG